MKEKTKINSKKKTATSSSKKRSVKNGRAKKSRKKDDIIQVNIRHVVLEKNCAKELKKIKDCMWGNVRDAIECGNWWIPVKNHNYTHMKSEFEKGMNEFFRIDNNIVVEKFDTDIICYDNHYPENNRNG